MTSLIKAKAAEEARSVRALVLGVVGSQPKLEVIDPEKLALQSELATARARVEDLETALAALTERHSIAFEEGRAKGHDAGLAAGEERAAQSLVLLEASAGAALELFGRDLASLNRLAPLLAHEGLRKVFGDQASSRALLDETVRHHLKTVDAQSVVRIEVSREDFPDAATIADLSERIGVNGINIIALDALSAGACRIKLLLGTLEVGAGQQWARLGAALLDLSEPEAAA